MKLSPVESQNASPTAPWLKNLLIDLLILSGLAGLAATAYQLNHIATGTPLKSPVFSSNQPNENLPEMPAILTRHKKVEITFQGMITGEKKAIAMVNNRMVTVGSAIEGVHIVDITSGRKLIIEYGNGQQVELSVGQTISVPSE